MLASFRVRPVTPADVDDLWEVHRAVLEDGGGAVSAKPWDRDGVVKRVAEILAGGEHAGKLVAEVDGRVVGEVELKRMGPQLCRHVATLGIEVHPSFQRRGLGRALMEAALDWCREHGITRLELYTRADNDRAIALYRSMGFVEEGRRRRFVRLPDGTYVDDLVMGLLLD